MTHVLKPQTRWYRWVQAIGILFLLVPFVFACIRVLGEGTEQQLPLMYVFISAILFVPLGLGFLFVQILDKEGTMQLDENGITFSSFFYKKFRGKTTSWGSIEHIKISDGFVVGRYSASIRAKARGNHLSIKIIPHTRQFNGLPGVVRLSLDHLPPIEKLYQTFRKYNAPLDEESFKRMMK